MPEAYLTIDDSPTPRTPQLLEFLRSRNLQALFFCRGDFSEEYFDRLKDIVSAGHILGNHLYSHRPASTLGIEKVKEEIIKTEQLIDRAYQSVGKEKAGNYLRFPYLDRGDGDKAEQRYHDIVKAVQSGSDQVLEDNEAVEIIQEFLNQRGYTQPFPDVTHPLYSVPEIRDAKDCLLTYTSYDWMLSPRHKGQQTYKTLDELKEKIDKDEYLNVEDSVNIALFHDDKEGIIEETCALIDHMLNRGIKFREFSNDK